MRKMIFMLAFSMLITNPTYADHSKDIVMLDANQVKIQVKGIVCSFCAFGVQKNLSKLKFLDSSEFKKGVLVDVEKQQITLAIAEDNMIDLKEVYKSIRKGGYDPEVVFLRVKGEIENENSIRDQETQLLFHFKSEKLSNPGLVEVDLHFDAKVIPSLSIDNPIDASLDRIIE